VGFDVVATVTDPAPFEMLILVPAVNAPRLGEFPVEPIKSCPFVGTDVDVRIFAESRYTMVFAVIPENVTDPVSVGLAMADVTASDGSKICWALARPTSIKSESPMDKMSFTAVLYLSGLADAASTALTYTHPASALYLAILSAKAASVFLSLSGKSAMIALVAASTSGDVANEQIVGAALLMVGNAEQADRPNARAQSSKMVFMVWSPVIVLQVRRLIRR